MGKHAWITPDGSVTVSTKAWLQQRVDGRLPELTGHLRRWANRHTPEGEPRKPELLPGATLRTTADWVATTRAWAEATDSQEAEPDVIVHQGTRLDTNLWIVRVTNPARRRLAVVGVNPHPPAVYGDSCASVMDWSDISVDILCGNGHSWTWRHGRELLTADLAFTTITRVFGQHGDTPFTPCPTCPPAAVGRAITCGCDGTPWIRCPTCGNRCDIELSAL